MPTLLVLFAGVMWGCIGIFGRKLSALGFSAVQVTTVRCLTNSALMFLLMLFTDKNKLKIDKHDIGWFVANGVFSIYIFSTAYQRCITMTSMATAVVLLYTAPVFVTVMSVILFKEKLTAVKLTSLTLCIIGSALVSGVLTGMVINPLGLGFGLLAGFGYALYSIFSSIILRKYHAFTNIFYTFLVAGLLGLATCRPVATFSMLSHSFQLSAWAVANGIFTSFLAYAAYTSALKMMNPSKASIIASIEPVVATAVGVLVFHEVLTLPGIVGICMVLRALVLQNLKTE